MALASKCKLAAACLTRVLCCTRSLMCCSPTVLQDLSGSQVTLRVLARQAPFPACAAALSAALACSSTAAAVGGVTKWVLEPVGTAASRQFRLRSVVRTC